jgi:hypothetical protein
MSPGAGPILTLGLLFEQTLKTLTGRCFMLNILTLAICFFFKEDFLTFCYTHK